jgi:tripartite-type tricarboxylate transporter receptor subunit TctC
MKELQIESGTRMINVLVPLCFRSSCKRVPPRITNFASGALADVMRKTILAVGLAALTALAGLAHAQQYPTRLIKMVHGFPPGGNVDEIARIMAQEMSNGLGQPIVVESKAGAVGSVAADAVAHAEPDGYTLLLVPSAHAVTGAIYPSLKYRPVDDFAWISTVSFYPFVICVRPESRFGTLADLLAAAAIKPETVSFGSSGIGTIQHMTAELLGSASRVKFLLIHYRGEALVMRRQKCSAPTL